MSLAKRLSEYKPPRLGGECRVCSLLRDLPKDESKVLGEALADPRFSNSGLAKVLVAEGYSMTQSTVGRHRRGECKGPS